MVKKVGAQAAAREDPVIGAVTVDLIAGFDSEDTPLNMVAAKVVHGDDGDGLDGVEHSSVAQSWVSILCVAVFANKTNTSLGRTKRGDNYAGSQ